VVEEGQILEVMGQKYLVISVEYAGEFSKPWVRNLVLRGIKDE